MKEWTEIRDGKEVKMVQYNWLFVEKEILDKKIKELAGDYDLFRATDLARGIGSSREPIHMGINWGGIGAQDAAVAKDFAERLMEACKLVDEFKYNGYYEDFQVGFDDLSAEEQAEIRQYAIDNGI